MGSLSVAASTWTFRNYSLLKALDVIHLLGITEVELWAEGAHLDPRGDLPDLEEVGSALDRLGLWPAAMHAPFRGLSLLETDATKRSNRIAVLQQTMDVAAALDCALLVVHVDGEGKEIPPSLGTSERAALLRTAADALRQLCAYGAERGITLLIENQPDRTGVRVGARVEELAEIVKTVDMPNVRLCFDVAHAVVSTGDWYGQWRQVVDYVMSVHVSDTKGTDDEHLPLGEGAIEWKRVIEALGEADPRPGVVLEVRGGEDAVQRSLSVFQ